MREKLNDDNNGQQMGGTLGASKAVKFTKDGGACNDESTESLLETYTQVDVEAVLKWWTSQVNLDYFLLYSN